MDCVGCGCGRDNPMDEPCDCGPRLPRCRCENLANHYVALNLPIYGGQIMVKNLHVFYCMDCGDIIGYKIK